MPTRRFAGPHAGGSLALGGIARMFRFLKSKAGAAPEKSSALVRRLFADYGRRHLKLFILTVVMMAVSSACQGIAAMLAGLMMDRAYVYKDFRGLMFLSVAVFAIFTVKGLATYGQAVTISYLGNRMTAENQRLMFDKLLREGVSYFADRHSTDFMARMSYAASAPPPC